MDSNEETLRNTTPCAQTGSWHPSKCSLVKWTFVHDQLATGRKRHVLTIIDRFSGYSPAIESRFMSWRYSGRWCPDGVGRTGARYINTPIALMLTGRYELTPG